MIAKEVHTSDSVKQLLVQAPGIDDDKWEQAYKGETGGILTVQSELGKPIHKIATRAVKLWKEFDKTAFKLAKDKRQAWLNANAESIIEKLNRNFAKPWFAQKDGTVVKDLGDLTYKEAVLCLVPLMYVKHQSRWIDILLRNLLLRHVEERFTGINDKPKQSILHPTTRSMTLSHSSPCSLRGTPRRACNCLPRKTRSISFQLRNAPFHPCVRC